MSEQPPETEMAMGEVKFYFWRDYNLGKIAIQREGKHAVYLTPVQARDKADDLRRFAGLFPTGVMMEEQAELLDEWADEIDEIQ